MPSTKRKLSANGRRVLACDDPERRVFCCGDTPIACPECEQSRLNQLCEITIAGMGGYERPRNIDPPGGYSYNGSWQDLFIDRSPVSLNGVAPNEQWINQIEITEGVGPVPPLPWFANYFGWTLWWSCNNSAFPGNITIRLYFVDYVSAEFPANTPPPVPPYPLNTETFMGWQYNGAYLGCCGVTYPLAGITGPGGGNPDPIFNQPSVDAPAGSSAILNLCP